jgi:fucose permease
MVFQIRSVIKLRPTLLRGNEVTEEDEIVTLGQMLKSFSIDWVVSLGFLCAILLEIAISDWATILARQEFGVSKSFAVIPYFLFMGAMIIGRVSFNRIRGSWSDTQLVQPFAVTGGLIFLTGLFLGLELKDVNLYLGYGIFCLASFICGIGISFIGPLFFGYASARSNKPGGVAIAELGAVNQLLTFAGRNVIAVVAGVTSLQVALIIPAVMFMLVAFFIKAASQPRD